MNHSEAHTRAAAPSIDGSCSAEAALAPSPLTRALARLRSHPLERALIAGADPTSSGLLAARAAQLTARPTRDELARSLERLLRMARQAPGRRAVALRRTSVLVNSSLLCEIASELHGPAPVYAQGVAILRELLTDGTGPLFTAAPDRPGVGDVLREARMALCGSGPD